MLLLHVLSSGDSASPLGDFNNLMYHPIKDFLLIFSLISPPFSQQHGFIPHGSSVLIFPIKQVFMKCLDMALQDVVQSVWWWWVDGWTS